VSPWDAERFEAVATLLAGHLGRLGRDLALARACDIGCGGGGLLVALRAQGVGVVVGVDLAEANVRLARAQAAVVAHTGSIDEVPDEMGLFDLVTVSHVAEHMVDPVRDLRVIAARTAPDGLIYVEVPDARGFSSYAAEPMREINIEHVNHFSPMTLRLLLESTGYAVRAEGSRIMHMGGSATPAVWAIGQRANHPPVTRPTLDTSLVDGLVEYLETSGAAYMELAARVAEVCRRHRHVKVWGASYVSEKLLGDGVFAGVDVVFVDGNPAKQGQLMGGAPVGPVEWLAHGTAPVVLTSASYEPEMLRRLRDELHHHGEVVSLSGAGRTAQGGEDHRQPR
jgi:SAM-dependent methyltransferase